MSCTPAAIRFLLTMVLGCMALTSCKREADLSSILAEWLPNEAQVSHLPVSLQQEIQRQDQATRHGPNQRDALVQLTYLYHANGLLQQAINCYEALIEIEPREPRWKHLLAFILATYGYGEDSERLWREVVALEPNYIPAKVRLGDILIKSNQPEEAALAYQEVLRLEPHNPYAMVGLARIHVDRLEWDQARLQLEAADVASSGRLGKDLLVTVYERLGMEWRAFAIRGEQIASGTWVDILDPWHNDMMQKCYDPTQLVNVAGIAAFAGNHEDAVQWFLRLLEIDPTHSGAHYFASISFQELGNAERTFFHLREAVKHRPNFSDAWLRLAYNYKMMGNTAEEDRVFYEGLAKCPNSPAYNIEYARRLIADKEFTRALPFVNKAIRLNPNEARPYIELASLMFHLDRVDEGAAAMRKALEVEAGNPIAMTTLCLLAIVKGDQPEADRWMEAIQQHPRVEASTRQDLRAKYRAAFVQ